MFVQVPARENVCGQSLFKTSPYYYNGLCFSFDPPKCLTDSGILEVGFSFKGKTDIFTHHSGQFLSPNSRYEGF